MLDIMIAMPIKSTSLLHSWCLRTSSSLSFYHHVCTWFTAVQTPRPLPCLHLVYCGVNPSPGLIRHPLVQRPRPTSSRSASPHSASSRSTSSRSASSHSRTSSSLSSDHHVCTRFTAVQTPPLVLSDVLSFNLPKRATMVDVARSVQTLCFQLNNIRRTVP